MTETDTVDRKRLLQFLFYTMLSLFLINIIYGTGATWRGWWELWNWALWNIIWLVFAAVGIVYGKIRYQGTDSDYTDTNNN